jgi:hypothetical protein
MRRQQKILLLALMGVVCLAQMPSGLVCAAQETSVTRVSTSSLAGLPIKQTPKTSPKKAKQANVLSQWVQETLQREQVKVAIITREGVALTKLFDKTGMTHSGYVFQNPKTGQWITYSLYSDPETNRKTSRLWQQDVESFYYEQSGRKTNALMLIPPMALQEKLLSRLTAPTFETLLPANEHYNLVAPLENPLSFNCTKWVLLQLFAAMKESSNSEWLLQQMATDYEEPVIKPFFLVRYVLQRKPDVNWQELSPPNKVHTVTVNSLFQSPYFEKKLFYHGE